MEEFKIETFKKENFEYIKFPFTEKNLIKEIKPELKKYILSLKDKYYKNGIKNSEYNIDKLKYFKDRKTYLEYIARLFCYIDKENINKIKIEYQEKLEKQEKTKGKKNQAKAPIYYEFMHYAGEDNIAKFWNDLYKKCYSEKFKSKLIEAIIYELIDGKFALSREIGNKVKKDDYSKAEKIKKDLISRLKIFDKFGFSGLVQQIVVIALRNIETNYPNLSVKEKINKFKGYISKEKIENNLKKEVCISDFANLYFSYNSILRQVKSLKSDLPRQNTTTYKDDLSGLGITENTKYSFAKALHKFLKKVTIYDEKLQPIVSDELKVKKSGVIAKAISEMVFLEFININALYKKPSPKASKKNLH
jgi:hypothetical protein